MKRRTKTSAVAALMTLLVGVAVVSALVFPASAADVAPSGHWVDNLGGGVTAAEFGRGNNHPDCQNPRFASGESDLWVFEIRGATNASSVPVWDGSVPSWTVDGSLTVVDVTTNYGAYLTDPTTKRLYIETSPPGARLNAAHLLYAGSSTAEVLLRTCAHELDVRLKGALSATYDLSYRWTIDAAVEWRVVDAFTFDVDYVATPSRADYPLIQPGSAHVRGVLELGEPSLPVQTAEISYLAGNKRQNCFVDPKTFSFDCTVDDSLLVTDPTTGQPIGIGSISVTAITPDGTAQRTFPIDWKTISPSNIFRTSAVIRNHKAMVAHNQVQVSKYETINFYQETWKPGSNYCTTQTQTFDLISEPTTSATPDDQTTTAVTWCRPRPGYSLQYLGGPYGVPLLIANKNTLESQYPLALAGLPPLSNRDEIRGFLDSLACIESCKALFRAQFLTAAFNALDPAFAQQTILIRDTCLTIAQFLEQVNAETPRMDETTLIIRKAELERINGALVTTCPTVSTSTNSPGVINPS